MADRGLKQTLAAFGAGEPHTTTLLAAAALVDALATHPGAAVLDVGTGTGILAALARRLGASRAVGIERDAGLIGTGRARHPDVEFVHGDALGDLPEGPFAIVVANLTDPPLRHLVPHLVARLEGEIIVSGVRLWQGSALRGALERSGAIVMKVAAANGWCAYRARAR